MHSHLQIVAGAIGATALLACSRGVPARHDASDSSFAAMQERGKMAMGVDQYTSAHRFDVLSDGGRIELQRGTDDSVGIRQIRAHLRLIQHAFEAGDFSTPEFVHMRAMPGTEVMTKKRDVIAYVYHDLPRGGEVRMTTRDPEALAAIHEFLRAQRGAHHAGGGAVRSK
jgi:hypothetical protein